MLNLCCIEVKKITCPIAIYDNPSYDHRPKDGDHKMEHKTARLRFKSEALPLAIASLNRPAFSRYELAILVWNLYDTKTLNDARIIGLSRATPNLRAFKIAEESLLSSGLIKNIGKDKSPFYTWRGAGESSKFELACCIDPFSAISHLSAMEWHGLSNRISERIFITTPSLPQWGNLARERMLQDLGSHFYKYIEVERLPYLSRPNIDRIGRRSLNRHETKKSVNPIKGSELVRVTSIGKTYLDMLQDPLLCGGIQHVFECIKDHASRHLKLIFNEFDASGTAIDKVRMGFLLEKLCAISHPHLDSWAHTFAARGGSRKLDPQMPYEPSFSSKWCISINAPLEVEDDSYD